MAQKPHSIVDQLKHKGFRTTKIRTSIINFFLDAKLPLSASDLLDFFENDKTTVNKTTVYRELEFLVKNNVIKEIEFGDRKKRYELDTGDHHHHLICLNCNKVQEIELESDLTSEEKKIEKEKDFQIVNHSLEFFGYCKNCQ